ncbi:MAG: hypothetical protein IKB99_11630 [Lentisphaeria bacterium]|nr:hypothetical protein [Lentisphaeria bacterium]
MLEITNLRDGAILNRHHGIETENYLEIKIEGLAAPQAEVTVNGEAVLRYDRQFFATVRLTQRINKITAVASDYFGERTLTLTVMWDKKSYRRCHFFFDDCCFFLRWIAQNKPQSIFDEMFLGRLKQIHEKYNSKFLLNLFYQDDHHKDFCLKDFPEDYKEEFQANKDWLRLSFHAYSEFPDRPYQHTDSVKLAEDYDLIYNEVCRFAGPECFMAPMVIHWAMTNPENFRALQERGTRCLTGAYMGSIVSVKEKAHSVEVTDIGYHYEQDVTRYLCKAAHMMYDRKYDIIIGTNILCCNYTDIEGIRKRFANLKPERDVIGLMTHEQYSFPDYFNYIPNHLDRVEEACRLAAEYGCEPAWFAEGIWGNMAWEK